MNPVLELPRIRAVLLSTKAAGALRGKNERQMRELAEGGSLIEAGLEWVFNVAVDAGSDKRDLRFYAGEIICPEFQRGKRLADVVNAILPPTRKDFPIGQLVLEWQVTHQHIYNLKTARELPPGSFTPRNALVSFLMRRLVK